MRRLSAVHEWGLGVAVAWGAVVLSVFPLVIFRSLHVTFWVGWRGLVATIFSIVGVAATSLAVEMVYRGFAFAHLSKGLGRISAVLILILIYGAVYGRQGPRNLLVACALSTLFFTGWLRTHAVWMSWGLHLGWALSLGLLFGLPLTDGGDLSGMVMAQVRGGLISFPALGPSGMVWTALVLLVAAAVLSLATREYAWRYTHPVIIAGGYPMEAAPPPAHSAMQTSAGAGSSPLIQIATPPGARADVGVTNEDRR